MLHFVLYNLFGRDSIDNGSCVELIHDILGHFLVNVETKTVAPLSMCFLCKFSSLHIEVDLNGYENK